MKEKDNFEIAQRREAIVNGMNKAIDIFTSHSEKEFDDVISKGLRPIAEAACLDRIVFYRNMVIDGEPRIGQIYMWDRAENGLVSLDEELRIMPKTPLVEKWFAVLSKNNPVRIRETGMDDDEQVFLRIFGVKSILIVPVFSHGEFWGAVALQDLNNDQYFDEGCSDLLHAAVLLCAGAIIRSESNKNANEAIEALKRREKIATTLNKMSVQFLSQSGGSFEAMMTEGIRLIADTIKIDRFSIWRNSTKPDGIYASQVYRWERKSGGTTVPNAGLESVAYHKYMPSWENILSAGETVNGPARLQPELERANMKAFGTVSIFVTPIFINNAFWGMVIYEDHNKERYFEEELTELMRSAAFLCANTVMRYDMEHIIAEESELNRAVVDALRIGFTVFDENMRVIEVNNASLSLFGCEKQYFIEHFFELSPEYQSDGLKSYDKAFDLLRRALNGENIIFEWTHLTFDGELLPFEITLTRAKYKGKYILLSYQYDLRNIKKITGELKKQSELLKVRLEQQELISEISSSFVSSGESKKLVDEAIAKLGHYHKVSMVVIFSLDDEKKDTYLAYYWISDNKRLRGIKLNLYELVKSNFPERMYDRATVPVLSCTDTASSNVEAFRELLSAGVNAFICAPLYVEGRLWGILSVQQYMNPRDWTDNEKGFVAMTASTIAGAIMLDIYNTKLKDAVKQMTAASKAKSEFLSNMSHEMRTPMNAIINMTVIAKNTTDVERKNYALDKIEDASTHLLGVINDILDMSKIEAKKFDLVPVEFVFEKMLQRVVNVVNFRIEDKKQKFLVHIDNDIPKTLIGDDQRLSQVITNLLGNAVKFTPENGSITLDSKLLGENDGVCELRISVSDTGIGISPEQQDRLFQSFQQAESSTVRKFGGTGLGLSISKSIVEMMGGKIWIESELGKGSSFIFTIQIKRGEDKKPALREKAINWDSIRILAVDDDQDILEFFKDVAKRFNLYCDTALNGEDALSLMREKGKYNIYFIDWKMPGMDGIALTSAIKATQKSPDNAIVIMNSAVEWSVIKDEAQEAGVDRFLSKPLFPSTIIDAISECFGVERNEIEGTQKGNVDFTGHRILLVEDMEINREIVMMLFESTHLDIDCAENGVQAIQMFCEEPGRYEIILMDVQMPEMDGYEATNRIRLIEKELSSASAVSGKPYRKVPIIAMTANVFKEDIDRCISAGMDDHVGKPLDYEVVMKKIRTYLL